MDGRREHGVPEVRPGDGGGGSAAASISAQAVQRAESLRVVVKEETPFLPKVAFTLITLASLAGATFTGVGLGMHGIGLGARWLALWSGALAGGFLIWRLCYLRRGERDLDPARVAALAADQLRRADRVGRWIVPLLLLAISGPVLSPYLDDRPWLRWGLVGALVVLATLLAVGVSRRPAAIGAAVVSGLLVVGWGCADAGAGWSGLVRVLHLTAFSLWIGGALWNIAVAMPVGRRHPHLEAVLAGARQLDRFRWVVRFALPTVIVTGLIMAGAYRMLPADWWLAFPGVLIPLKVLCIVALVVVFIACPLFRQCSPVQGVCNVDDLNEPMRLPGAERTKAHR